MYAYGGVQTRGKSRGSKTLCGPAAGSRRRGDTDVEWKKDTTGKASSSRKGLEVEVEAELAVGSGNERFVAETSRRQSVIFQL